MHRLYLSLIRQTANQPKRLACLARMPLSQTSLQLQNQQVICLVNQLQSLTRSHPMPNHLTRRTNHQPNLQPKAASSASNHPSPNQQVQAFLVLNQVPRSFPLPLPIHLRSPLSIRLSRRLPSPLVTSAQWTSHRSRLR